MEPIDSAADDANGIHVPSAGIQGETSAEPGESIGEAQQAIPLVFFAPSDFPFGTTIKDDGKGKGGGWQEAHANLEFWRVVIPRSIIRWHCPLTIGMPLRTQFMGKISPKCAAIITVELTDDVARRMDYKFPQGIFCEILPVKYG